MSFFGRVIMCALSAALFAAVNGCSPDDSNQSSEENEPHYVLGKSRFNEMNYDGAVEAFQESLEVNPHSAQAHYQLAQIFDTQRPDPAAAIYHYQEYLKLCPDAPNHDVITQRIQACKRQLAEDVLQLPSTPAMQRQLDYLVQTNHDLQTQIDQLNGVIRQWNAYYQSELAAKAAATATAPAGGPTPTVTSSTPDDISTAAGGPQTQSQSQSSSSRTTATTQAQARARTASSKPYRGRTHIVERGETLAAIARHAGVSLATLEAANPQINPKRLRVGESVNLPP